MSYSQLGISCIPQTIACTSNHKFIPLHSYIYKRSSTYMLQYPDIDTNKQTSNVSTPSYSGNLNIKNNETITELPVKINSST
jgi:hypothetical protein